MTSLALPTEPSTQIVPIIFATSFAFNRWWSCDAEDRSLFSFAIRWWPEHRRPSLWISLGAVDISLGWFEVAL